MPCFPLWLFKIVSVADFPAGFNSNLGLNQPTVLRIEDALGIGAYAGNNLQVVIEWRLLGALPEIPLKVWSEVHRHNDNTASANQGQTLTMATDECVTIGERSY